MKPGSINERIKELVEKISGGNKSAFARKAGLTEANVRNAITGPSKPSFDVIANITEKIIGINPRWLILGEGEMFEEEIAAGDYRPGKATEKTELLKKYSDTLQALKICEARSQLLEARVLEQEGLLKFFTNRNNH